MTGTVGQDNDRGTVRDRNRNRVTGTVEQDNDRGTVTDRKRNRVTGTVGQDNDRGTVTDRNGDRVTGTVGQEQRDQDGRKGKTELHRGKDRNWNRDRRTWTGTEG